MCVLTDHQPVNHQETERSDISEITESVIVNAMQPKGQCAQNIISMAEDQRAQMNISKSNTEVIEVEIHSEETDAQHVVHFEDARDRSDAGSLITQSPQSISLQCYDKLVDADAILTPLKAMQMELEAANKSDMRVHGMCSLELSVHGLLINIDAVVVDLNCQAILGMDISPISRSHRMLCRDNRSCVHSTTLRSDAVGQTQNQQRSTRAHSHLYRNLDYLSADH